jgi:hypothetical protein
VQKSVLSVLFSFNIELINILTSEIALLVLFVVIVSQFHFILAQIGVCFGIAVGCIICELFFAISVTKILLVTHFHWIFPVDPSQLGGVIILIAVIVAFLPCAAVCTYETLEGSLVTNSAGYLAGVTYCHHGMSFLHKLLMFWMLLAFFTLLLTLLYIPHHLEHQGISQAIQAGECNAPKKEINLKRIVLGFFGLIFHLIVAVLGNYTGMYKGFPLNAYSSTTSLNLMLIYFVLDKNVLKCIRKEVLKRLMVFMAYFKVPRVAPEPCHVPG